MADDPKPGQSAGQGSENVKGAEGGAGSASPAGATPTGSAIESGVKGTPAPGSDGKGAEGGKTPSWFETLPPGLKAEGSLQAFKDKDVAALAESHVNAQKMVGGSIRLPKEDATPEEKDKFYQDIYTKMGRPAKWGDYKLPDGTDRNDPALQRTLEVLHKAGVTQSQLTAYYDHEAKEARNQDAAVQEQMQVALKSLEEGDAQTPGWGAATPRHLANVKRLIEVLGGQSVMDKISKSGLGNDTEYIRFMAKIAQEAQEDGLISPESVTPSVDLQKEHDEMKNGGKEHPLWKNDHPRHDEYVKRFKELNQLIYNKA